jgi:Uma2 family endonuclease
MAFPESRPFIEQQGGNSHLPVVSMALPESHPFITIEEYLRGEESSELRHEYIGGAVYAMVGASRRHNTLALNLGAALQRHLQGGPCHVFMSDVKVRLRVRGDEIFYYPDLVVACEPSDREPYYVEQPRLIVEVLSETTERIDRREKLFAYTSIPSLQEYVLVAQARSEVTIYRRRSDWAGEILCEGELRLETVELSIPVASIYEGVE